MVPFVLQFLESTCRVDVAAQQVEENFTSRCKENSHITPRFQNPEFPRQGAQTPKVGVKLDSGSGSRAW